MCRHKQATKITNQQLAKSNGLFTSFPPYYTFQTPPVLENETAVLYWDKQVITDKTIYLFKLFTCHLSLHSGWKADHNNSLF